MTEGYDHRDWQTKREIPGVLRAPGYEYFYLEAKDKKAFNKFFRFSGETPEPHPTSGGLISENCQIITPDGRSFFGMCCHGDVEAWKREVYSMAKAMGMNIATINEAHQLVCGDVAINLAGCIVKYYVKARGEG